MAKSKKIDLKKVILTIDNNNILHIEGFEGEEVPFENLTEEIKDLIDSNKPVNIKINKARLGGSSNRKPMFKYQCKSCGKEVKSKEENLEAKCMDCNCEFINVSK